MLSWLMHLRLFWGLCVRVGGHVLCDANCQRPPVQSAAMALIMEAMRGAQRNLTAEPRVGLGNTSARTPCVDGFAGSYSCSNVDLQSHLDFYSMGCPNVTCGGSDLWGWVDSQTGKEYVLMTMWYGISVVDVTDSVAPLPVAFVPTAQSFWQDVKVYADHMLYVCESDESLGLQVFDLTRVRGRTTLTTMEADTVFTMDGNLTSAHNIFVHEERGVAYILGSTLCAGGLFMVNVSDPVAPEFCGCFWEDGYTHDVQCVVYAGPDTARHGRDICFAYNEDSLTIVDVTDSMNPVQLSRTEYNGSAYTHQGWLTPDMKYVLLDDEFDEYLSPEDAMSLINYDMSYYEVWDALLTRMRTVTYIVDCSDLENPVFKDSFTSSTSAIDHNQYITDNWFAFQSNYQAGLRVLDIIDMQNIHETAFFDVFPGIDVAGFHGVWSNYPFFPSGNVALSSIEYGLFIVKPTNIARAWNTSSTPTLNSSTSPYIPPTMSPTVSPTVSPTMSFTSSPSVAPVTTRAGDDTSSSTFPFLSMFCVALHMFASF